MATDKKPIYGEAYMLMTYRDPRGRTERLWNSRDGITPFSILIPEQQGRSPEPGEKPVFMSHINFRDDVRMENFVPRVGMRIFTDIEGYDEAKHGPHNVEVRVVDEALRAKFAARADEYIASRLDAREVALVEADIQDFFGKLGAVSRTNDPKGSVCGWHVVNGRIPILRDDLPIDCTLEIEEECPREHRRSILQTVRAAYEAGRAAAPDNRLLEAASAVVDSASITYRKSNGHIGSIEGDDGEQSRIVPFDAFEDLVCEVQQSRRAAS